EVLSDLLTGPRFDYILLGSDGDPNSVTSIILTANQSSPSAGAAMAQSQPARATMPPQVDTDDEAEEDQASQPAAPPAQPAQQAPPGHRPFIPQQPPDQVGGQPSTSGEGGQQVKSPEQLLEQLRRMQQPGNPQQNEQ
ncbi:MAG: hypothetical protein WA188_12330, partial [Terriglobales bacterium]